jgi:hypothetical protein
MLPTFRPGIGKYANRIYCVVAKLPWLNTEFSVFQDAAPAVANGDMSAATLTSPGAYEVDLTSTGVVVIDTDSITVRQSFYCDVYDNSLRKWYGDTLEWVNNALPVYSGGPRSVAITTGEVIAPVSIAASTTDADNDVLTYTVTSGSLPPGLTLDPLTGIITGTP